MALLLIHCQESATVQLITSLDGIASPSSYPFVSGWVGGWVGVGESLFASYAGCFAI